MMHLYAFIEGLKLLPKYLLKFLKKLYCILFIYGFTMAIPLLVAAPIGWLLSIIPGVGSAAWIVFKIIFTVGQIIPLSIYLHVAEDELQKTDEDAPELCFAFCAAVITLVWVAL